MIVEFALVLSFLLLLGLGTVEMGMGWVANDRVETAVAQAARVAAVSGTSPLLLVAARLAIDRYLDRIATAAMFFAMRLASAKVEANPQPE